MPFTPLHFGPHACIAVPLHRYIDIPVFLGANVIIDLEPLLVLVYDLDYPLHGHCHTLLIGGLLGLVWGAMALAFRPLWVGAMKFLRFPYATGPLKICMSAVAGAWVHVLFDASIYSEINLFWPFPGNPLYGLSTYGDLSRICMISFIPALAAYGLIVARRRSHPQADKN